MQACDSLIGNVGGEHISTAKVFSILILIFFLIIQYILAPWYELHSRHGDSRSEWERGSEGGKDHAALFQGEKGTKAFRGGWVTPGFPQEDVSSVQVAAELSQSFASSICIWANEQKERVGETFLPLAQVFSSSFRLKGKKNTTQSLLCALSWSELWITGADTASLSLIQLDTLPQHPSAIPQPPPPRKPWPKGISSLTSIAVWGVD